MTKPPFPPLKDFRPFLGYNENDYDAAKSFYKDLGFVMNWDDGKSACEFDTGGGQRFLVTMHYGLDRGQAGMMSLWVDSVYDWQTYLAKLDLPKKYPDVKVAEPTITDWGWRILYVWDPGGWLLHIGEPHTQENQEFFAGLD